MAPARRTSLGASDFILTACAKAKSPQRSSEGGDGPVVSKSRGTLPRSPVPTAALTVTLVRAAAQSAPIWYSKACRINPMM
jgi:hypothetical protein